MPRALLWFALFGGPVAWTAHLLSSYPLVPWACGTGSVLVLHGITAAMFLVAVGAAASGGLALRRYRVGDDLATHRARFMGRVGALLGILFALAILAEGLPPLLSDPCLLVGT
jgi:hypothetical protein